MIKEPAINGAEQDWINRAPYAGNPRSVGRTVKRAMSKRARRRAVDAVQEQVEAMQPVELCWCCNGTGKQGDDRCEWCDGWGEW